MKKLLTIIFLPLLAACSVKESGSTEHINILEDLSFSIDTVVIDPGDEIINIKRGARFSTVSLDAQKYYYYDYDKTSIHEIDLETLKLTDTHQFSKEGPNSIGFNPPKIQPLSDERFLFVSSGINVGTFNKNGEKEKSLKFNFREIEGLEEEGEGLITYNAQISENEKLLFALTRPDMVSSDVRLIILDPNTKIGKSLSLPEFIHTLNFKISLKTEKFFRGVGEAVNLNTLNDQLFITSTANSDTYIYDYQSDSLRLVEFPHQLVPNKKIAEVKNKVEDEAEFEAEWAKFKYQISFAEFLWDKERQQYFRFAYQLISNEDLKLEKKSEVFLFAYDKDLNLIGETQLENVEYRFESPFFKDGKLWSYVNVEDELGFAVFTFDFEEK
jgi:hypothetical protein